MRRSNSSVSMRAVPQPSVKDQPWELEANDLRAELARRAAELDEQRARLEAFEARQRELAEAQAAVRADDPKRPSGAKQKTLLDTLARANKGRPGRMTAAQLEQTLRWTHSETHYAIKALSKAGRVWVREHWDEHNGRRCLYVYDLRAAAEEINAALK